MESIKKQIFAYGKETYGVEPDYPFPTAPDCPVLRHADSRKWFALFMDVPRNRLGLEGEERVEVVNLKCSAALSGALRKQAGILPGYHMHRESWITVLLDGTVPLEDILPLVDLSYILTEAKKRPGR
jgi:predicted DNA-binding protein (MmcQ/YjbR family)